MYFLKEDRILGDPLRKKEWVSWIRRRDFHVLTVALHTYTADDRFVAVNMDRSDDWMLQIKLAQLADEGLYECQVNTHPLISFFVNLTVLVPKSSIREAPDLYVKTGSSINLTCIISKSPEPPVFVFWYHNDRMINYDSSGGDISVHKAGQDTAISRLFIKNAQPSDSGNYTCCPSNADASSISVHVLNGKFTNSIHLINKVLIFQNEIRRNRLMKLVLQYSKLICV
ncbi:ig-like domain-containing protein [Trichonephila inaurata madagascariensis]|uniref:Ig-like domain-containing protein n=1 Tax=Trichonephila inaurata madagascariensis TaxID=2747483 RepID=A0A8X6YBC7_9ARAC|nr:ig-like domain-containing protein [Trichonephila inaurata madagascariensis]